MGMFDNLICQYPLPEFKEMQDRVFQTKSIGRPYLRTYTITEENHLLVREMEEEEGDDCPSFFTGEVYFYDFLDEGNYRDMVEFVAEFTNGNLSSIKCITDKSEIGKWRY